ncbi:apyrase-like [Belonocnema kinseyi]|uniref:apyrase-like n=1 Tax=Belonocnema kinseyi TaxID=2817044 RepID=UPI00143D8195|nr:apyrase-like [Belonocnema kinseyi]
MFSKLVIIFLAYFVFEKCEGFTARGLVYPGRTDLFELSVIHINDFHARFLQTGPASGTCNQSKKQDCIGGIARVSTASRQLLNDRPNAIFLNAGDQFQGSFWYFLFKWNVTAEFMNKLPLDAMTIGNHEFDDGIAGLVPFLQKVKAPVVVSNINDANEPTIKGLYQNSTIIERGGRKIGIIGVILSTVNLLSKTERLEFSDEVKTVNAEADRLKAGAVEIIIVLSHCGISVDRIMAAKCPNIDIIVGGHSHTFLYSGTKPFTEDPEDEYPVVVKQKESRRTVLIVQAAAFTRYIGNLTVWFNSQGEVIDWDGNPILLDQSIEEDPEILKALQPWKEEVDKVSKVKIGTTKVYLSGKSKCRQGECNLGNMVSDAMVDYYVGKSNNERFWTRAAISLINSGGIQGDISNNPIDITYEDIVVIAPLGLTYDLIELKGSDIAETLEKAVLESYYPTKFFGKAFLQWSGLKVTYNLSNPDNSKLVDVKIRCQACEYPKYESLSPEEWYKVVVSSFLLNGGDNHTIIQKNHLHYEQGPLDRDVLVNFIKKKSPITYGNEDRVTLLGIWNKK